MRSVKLFVSIIVAWFVCAVYLISAAAAPAPSSQKQPLPQVFDQLVIIPYPFQGKALVNGKKTNVGGNDRIADRSGRVFVPIRLMADLINKVDNYHDFWQTNWHASHPKDVILSNGQLHKTIHFTVGSQMVTVNGKPQSMDDAPQKIGGRIMLPLRSASEALGKHIDWLDGLILLGNEAVDLQNPQTITAVKPIKSELNDSRKPADLHALTPVAKVGNTIYYTKSVVTKTGILDELYRRTGDGKEIRIAIGGDPMLANARQVNGVLYFLGKQNKNVELDAYHFSDNRLSKVASIGAWDEMGVYLSDVRMMDHTLYFIVHRGDATLGEDTLYKVDQGNLSKVAGDHAFIQYVLEGDRLYAMNFTPMNSAENNLQAFDLKTGKPINVGVPGFAYGILRKVSERETSYQENPMLVYRGGYLYALGFRNSDVKDEGGVYRIDPGNRKQIKLTPPARQFWIQNNVLFYIDADTGYLVKADLDGSHPKTLIRRQVVKAKFDSGSIYYTANSHSTESGLGQLYQYHLSSGKDIQLSDRGVSNFDVETSGVYYTARGYRPGIYKVNAKGNNEALVQDDINAAVYSESGAVYTLMYRNGIFTTK